MSTEKPKNGGARPNAGRKAKYSEPTTAFSLMLSVDLKEKFSSAAKNQGKTESEFLHSLIIDFLNNPPPTNLHTIETEIQRLTLRLPKILLKASKFKASKKGVNLTGWVRLLIQTSIAKSSAEAELKLLQVRESNQNLLIIGRNLNRITKTINSSINCHQSISTEVIRELEKEIADLVQSYEISSKAVHAFMEASYDSWGISE